ncbi:NAD(P)/FAD-dependent oxidoreductase [Dendrosporobacter sp. 1207_IL3150]|uniref:NAD(P)/FAD-dependent oxidoreductase n=1 Tax=Dendrosporobacter sp. 1207_IL3150 TaxID=3084054 RepID=UPI002FDA2215
MGLPRIVVVGAGFGGLQIVRELAEAPVSITLVDRCNYHLFQPLLYQVATSGLAPEDIAHPVRAILKHQQNVSFRMAEVSSIDLTSRNVETTTGKIEYDYLVLAFGGVTNYFGLYSAADYAFGLKNIDDAIAIRNHILNMFELAAQQKDEKLRKSMLTFVIVGGGPTGVECAGAMSELVNIVLMKEYPELDFSEVQILLLEGSDRLLPSMPANLSEATAQMLSKKQVKIKLNAIVADYDGDEVVLKSGEKIPSCSLIWAAGVRAASIADKIGLVQGSMGRIVVTPTLQVESYPEVLAVGDAAYLEVDGRALPMIAPVAVQQAKAAAKNIVRLINGQKLLQFEYKDPGALATIGRNAAVAAFGKYHFSGIIAWFLWLVVHIIRLIGFRNRIMVVINWAWDYFFFERAVRLIMAGKEVYLKYFSWKSNTTSSRRSDT